MIGRDDICQKVLFPRLSATVVDLLDEDGGISEKPLELQPWKKQTQRRPHRRAASPGSQNDILA
jgi:hypothetical protein